LIGDGRASRLVLARVDAELEPLLRDAGFVPTPKGLARYA